MMKHKVLLRMTFLLVLLLGLPLLFYEGGQGCSIASAQDNPCLSQDATISAMQLELLGAQATASAAQLQILELQSTNTALEASSGGAVSVPSTSTTCDPYPISETFDDNARGISTISQEHGRATVADGLLQMRFSSDREDKILLIPLPNICIETDFYVEADVGAFDFPNVTSGELGIAIGNIELLDYHTFTVRHDEILVRHITGQDVKETLIRSSYENFISDDIRIAKLGIEGRNGIITVYVNGTDYEALPLELKGNSVAAYTQSTGFAWGGTLVILDNLVVRSAR